MVARWDADRTWQSTFSRDDASWIHNSIGTKWARVTTKIAIDGVFLYVWSCWSYWANIHMQDTYYMILLSNAVRTFFRPTARIASAGSYNVTCSLVSLCLFVLHVLAYAFSSDIPIDTAIVKPTMCEDGNGTSAFIAYMHLIERDPSHRHNSARSHNTCIRSHRTRSVLSTSSKIGHMTGAEVSSGMITTASEIGSFFQRILWNFRMRKRAQAFHASLFNSNCLFLPNSHYESDLEKERNVRCKIMSTHPILNTV